MHVMYIVVLIILRHSYLFDGLYLLDELQAPLVLVVQVDITCAIVGIAVGVAVVACDVATVAAAIADAGHCVCVRFGRVHVDRSV